MSGGVGDERSLTRATVNLTARAVDALERACALTGDSKTDTINRALPAYVVALDLAARNSGHLTVRSEDGALEHVYFL